VEQDQSASASNEVAQDRGVARRERLIRRDQNDIVVTRRRQRPGFDIEESLIEHQLGVVVLPAFKHGLD
jgi:hypothetical protein